MQEHYEKNNECLICRMLKEEKEFEQRVIFENEDFTVVLPFYRVSYGVYIIQRSTNKAFPSLLTGKG